MKMHHILGCLVHRLIYDETVPITDVNKRQIGDDRDSLTEVSEPPRRIHGQNNYSLCTAKWTT
jgi:hypothetical protein